MRPPHAIGGETITFIVTLTNNGFSSATNVQVSDLLPAGLTFVAATPSQGTYNSVSGVWTVGAVGNTLFAGLQIKAARYAREHPAFREFFEREFAYLARLWVLANSRSQFEARYNHAVSARHDAL